MIGKSGFKISLIVFVQWVITAGALAWGYGYATGLDNVCYLQIQFAEHENASADIFLEQNMTEGAILHLNYAVYHCNIFRGIKHNCFYLNQHEREIYSEKCMHIKNRLHNLTWNSIGNLTWNK